MGGLRPWARYGLLVVAQLLVLGLGAAVLQALEGPPALRVQAKLRAERATFQEEYGACLPPGALEELLSTVLAAQAHGVSSLGNGSEARNWDLPSALLFAASILTTTGKAARQPGRRGPLGSLGVQPFAQPQNARQNPGPLRPDLTAQAPHTSTPQLVPQLQLPGGVWPLPSPSARHSVRSRKGAQTPRA